ncbi:hypothetical protein EVAR_97846_1 [Eumeta japonica]|uniref:Uncharacterized protein n=1 Tax=Eumeta variegata TaxID=151549 RepID=A0A4C1WW26_EUMVA|nr:hypothetical protein EVAR_97846_1 [Eumeta japonica]
MLAGDGARFRRKSNSAGYSNSTGSGRRTTYISNLNPNCYPARSSFYAAQRYSETGKTDKRIDEPSESRRSSPPIEIRMLAATFPASWAGLGYLMERDRT